MRICSGRFEKGIDVYLNKAKRKVRLNQADQMFASERKIVEDAYAGDIIGLYDSGLFSIGETISQRDDKLLYDKIPSFMPEHFARVKQTDTMKRKQFVKGIEQIALEGAIQIFNDRHSGMEDVIVGVVGVLQFDVFTYRLKTEYNVDITLEPLPYEYLRYIANPQEINPANIDGTQDMKLVEDIKANPILLFAHEWSIKMVLDRNKDLKLKEYGED